MKIVIDLGCVGYGGPDDSIPTLIDRYQPDLLLGYDPQAEETEYTIGATRVFISRVAAWTFTGSAEFSGHGQTAGIRADGHHCLHADRVRCFDLASLLHALPPVAETIVKVDVEGAEYPLLLHMYRSDAIECAAKWLVEWHTESYTNGHEGGLGRWWYEACWPERFEVWHDPLHARCCNGQPDDELARAGELVIPF